MITIGLIILMAIALILWGAGRRFDKKGKKKDNAFELLIVVIVIISLTIGFITLGSYVSTNNKIGQRYAEVRGNKGTIQSLEDDDAFATPAVQKKILDLKARNRVLVQQAEESNKSCRQLILVNCY